MMTTVKTLDGVLPVKPLSYVLGDDWTYLYSDSWKGVEFNKKACKNGEIVPLPEAKSLDYFFYKKKKKTIDKMPCSCYN